MRKINKRAEPANLTSWKRNNPSGHYGDLSRVERQNIRKSCSVEQHYLCAYCCQRISGKNTDTINEHIKPQKRYRNLTLDYNNIVAVCHSPNQCGRSKDNQDIPITPLMSQCETDLRFKIDGSVEGRTDDANTTIDVLKLGRNRQQNGGLIAKRKGLIDSLIYAQSLCPNNIRCEDDELLEFFIDDLKTPKDGMLEPYSPILVNILQNFLNP